MAEDFSEINMGPLPNQIGFLLRLAQVAAFQDFIRRVSVVDITPAQHSVLTMIQSNPGIRQSDLSSALTIKRANMVPLLDGLEKRRLVRRRRAENDRRSYTLQLTDKGEELMRILVKLRQEHENRIAEVIGEEARAQLLEILPKFQKLALAGTDVDLEMEEAS